MTVILYCPVINPKAAVSLANCVAVIAKVGVLLSVKVIAESFAALACKLSNPANILVALSTIPIEATCVLLSELEKLATVAPLTVRL